MTKSESQAKKELEQDGWTVFKNGWPDFLAIKGNQCKFVEIKTGSPSLSKDQSEMCRLLWKFTKISYEIKYIKMNPKTH